LIGLASRDCDPHPAAAAWYPLNLEPSFRERVWGQPDLSYLYASRPPDPLRVGEVWLTADDNRVTNGVWAGKTLGEICRLDGAGLLGRAIPNAEPSGSPAFPLLVKFVFTADKMSVQVHPSDQYAREREGGAGKTEMWHVLQAEPGARLAIGFREDLVRGRQPDVKTLREAAESGAIERMLNWMDVRAGDTFFLPAGTVHAIGAGLIMCEIQQNSDLTYRLYDYNRPGTDGRPRPLHLDKALDVMEWRSNGGRTGPLQYRDQQSRRVLLAACPYFATEKLQLDKPASYTTAGRFEIWIVLEGDAEVEAAGQRSSCRKGEVVVMPAGAGNFLVNPGSPCVCLRVYSPELEGDVIAPLRAQGFSDRELRSVCFPLRPLPSGDAA
jgi:mannose-6-phosphate isomerase